MHVDPRRVHEEAGGRLDLLDILGFRQLGMEQQLQLFALCLVRVLGVDPGRLPDGLGIGPVRGLFDNRVILDGKQSQHGWFPVGYNYQFIIQEARLCRPD